MSDKPMSKEGFIGKMFGHKTKAETKLAGAGAPIVPQKFEARVMEPPTKPKVEGRGRPPIAPGHTPLTSPEPGGKKKHTGRRVVGTTIAAGILAAPPVAWWRLNQDNGSTTTTTPPATAEPTVPVTSGPPTTVEVTVPPVTTTRPTEPTVATTLPPTTEQPQNTQPTSTEVSTTTEPAPPTTSEPKPTDVVEDRGEYQILRNGATRFTVELEPGVNATFDLHLKTVNDEYGFRDAEPGIESAKDVLLRNILKTFAGQHAEFVSPDGIIDTNAYKDFLKANNWIDPGIFIPDNISEPRDRAKDPPVVKSSPHALDFRQPIIINNGDITNIEGLDPFSGIYDYYYTTTADDTRGLIAITEGNQLILNLHTINPISGKISDIRLSQSAVYLSENIGLMLSVMANINNPLSPDRQWLDMALAYAVPAGIVKPYEVPNYSYLQNTVMNLYEFVTPDFTNSPLFTKLA